MKDYKRLGDYIREVNVRNRELKVTRLLGLSMTKQFRPSTSNIVGVDLSNYKIVNQNTFAFDPMSVIRVHKVPIAINDMATPIIVSPAYYTFEVLDTSKLLPQYLMMWIMRPEFDRYADFKSDSAVRGGYDWKEFCDTPICVPSIERQREIVSEYETLTRRIRLNEQMIEKLEATAQALYRHTFVDNIDKQNLPDGWRMGTLGEICEIKYGKAHEGIPAGTIPIYGSGGVMRYGNKALYQNPSVLIPRKGSLNNIMYVDKPFWTVDTMFYTETIIPNALKYLYLYLKQFDFLAMDVGSAVPSMTSQSLKQTEMIIPDERTLNIFDSQVQVILNDIDLKQLENKKLTELQSLLLAKMGNNKIN